MINKRYRQIIYIIMNDDANYMASRPSIRAQLAPLCANYAANYITFCPSQLTDSHLAPNSRKWFHIAIFMMITRASWSRILSILALDFNSHNYVILHLILIKAKLLLLFLLIFIYDPFWVYLENVYYADSIGCRRLQLNKLKIL